MDNVELLPSCTIKGCPMNMAEQHLETERRIATLEANHAAMTANHASMMTFLGQIEHRLGGVMAELREALVTRMDKMELNFSHAIDGNGEDGLKKKVLLMQLDVNGIKEQRVQEQAASDRRWSRVGTLSQIAPWLVPALYALMFYLIQKSVQKGTP